MITGPPPKFHELRDNLGPANLDELLHHHELRGVEVDVDPAQTAGLAATYPAERYESPHEVEGLVGGEGQELLELICCPDGHGRSLTSGLPRRHSARGPDHGVRAGVRWKLDHRCRIGADQPAPHCCLERAA
jgi:hypothetical protein